MIDKKKKTPLKSEIKNILRKSGLRRTRVYSADEDKGYMEMGDLFYQVMSKYIASEKIPKYFGIDQKLYPSEIHMIYAIGKNPGMNVTELAKFLGITKGAVPKMVRKLTSKGLVESFKNGENRKEVFLRLTAEGKKAKKGYLRYHEERGSVLKKFYLGLKKEEIKIVMKTLNEVGRYADMILEE